MLELQADLESASWPPSAAAGGGASAALLEEQEEIEVSGPAAAAVGSSSLLISAREEGQQQQQQQQSTGVATEVGRVAAIATPGGAIAPTAAAQGRHHPAGEEAPLWGGFASTGAAAATLQRAEGHQEECQHVGGHQIGCRQGCSCAWGRQCYPKHVPGMVADQGVCSVSMHLLIVLAVATILGSLAAIVVVRLILQHKQYMAEKLDREARARAKFEAGLRPPSAAPEHTSDKQARPPARGAAVGGDDDSSDDEAFVGARPTTPRG